MKGGGRKNRNFIFRIYAVASPSNEKESDMWERISLFTI